MILFQTLSSKIEIYSLKYFSYIYLYILYVWEIYLHINIKVIYNANRRENNELKMFNKIK